MGGDVRGLRVALVLGTSTGGVGRHVRSLAAGLASRGCRVSVLAPPPTLEFFRFGEAAAVAAVDIADRPRPVPDARAVARLRGLLRDADVVHAHGLRAGGLAALALAGWRRPALAVTLHNAAVSGGLVGVVYRVLEHVVYRRADVVLAVSPDLLVRARGRGAREVEHAVVPAPPLPPPRRDRAAVRADLGAAERPLVLCVARLAEQKGLHTFLDASACWADRVPPPLAAVVGDGPLAATLTDAVRERRLPVRLLGTRTDVAELLAAADVVVVPSRWEGQPLTVQEALRAGRPVVATRVGGIPDMVGDAAVLVPPGDVSALAEAVAEVVATPALADRLHRAALRRAARLPGEADALDQVADLYRRLRIRARP